MARTFGLICEGDTDLPVILNSLAGYFNDKNVLLNQIQPLPRESGGWTRIFSFCSSDRFLKSLELVDFLVIQIDTDRRMDLGFDIHNYNDTRELIILVKEKIISKIGLQVFNSVSHKIIFAIAVHSIECWLIPFYAKNKKQESQENSCEKHINPLLKGKGLSALNKADRRTYYEASKLLSHSKTFHQKKKLQLSLLAFTEELDLKFG